MCHTHQQQSAHYPFLAPYALPVNPHNYVISRELEIISAWCLRGKTTKN